MSTSPDDSIDLETRLDNALWHTLTTHHRHLGVRHGRAARYDLEVGIFAGVEAEDDDSMSDLGALVGPGGFTALRRTDPAAPLPGPFDTIEVFPALQMVSPPFDGFEPPADLIDLGPDDVDEMIDLTNRTEPGPFFTRTIDLGRYVGLRRDGVLIAMAGERMRVDGATEISAVCVDPGFRRQGLAEAVTLSVAKHIQDRGDLACLHVRSENAPAVGLYERLGFTTRRELAFVALLHTGDG